MNTRLSVPSLSLKSLCLGALLLTCAALPARAQAVADAPCLARVADRAAVAACASVGKAASISPGLAAIAKAEHGRAVLLLDVRSHAEAAFGGQLPQADALVPFAEVAQPLRWDSASGSLALERMASFAGLVEATVAVLDGDHDTPLLLVCRNGGVAEQAAVVLRAQGFKYVTAVQGGIDGSQSDDGPQYAGWKAAGLPWLAQADPVFLFGETD
jgi:rhodanese-related sulfurtransferase